MLVSVSGFENLSTRYLDFATRAYVDVWSRLGGAGKPASILVASRVDVRDADVCVLRVFSSVKHSLVRVVVVVCALPLKSKSNLQKLSAGAATGQGDLSALSVVAEQVLC